MIIETRALPETVQSALKSLGFHKRDISIEAKETARLNSCGSTGTRAFVCIVDLETGQTAVTRGSWGGPNMFNPRNAVDVDDRPQPIPPNTVIITGSEGGGRPVRASLITNPATLQPLLPAPSTLDDRQKRVLSIHRSIKAGPYRQEELNRLAVIPADIDALVAEGYLSRNKAGSVTITTKGKQACEGTRSY